MAKEKNDGDVLSAVFATLEARKDASPEESYTARLLGKGLEEISKKVGEEAIEVILAGNVQSRERLIEEIADLTYHVMVLMLARDLTPADIAAELERRHKP